MQQVNSIPAVPTSGATLPRSSERQVLTFTLGSNTADPEAGVSNHATDYGIELAEVQEIRGYTPATPIPNTPSYIKGAINLRGALYPGRPVVVGHESDDLARGVRKRNVRIRGRQCELGDPGAYPV